MKKQYQMNIANIIYSNKNLSRLYCKISQLRFPNFEKEVERRAKLDIFDYKDIAQPLPKCYFELCTDNNCFGIGYCIRQYMGSKQRFIDALAEHGYFFGSYVQEMEKVSFTKKLLTFGDIRKKHIEAKVDGKDVICIGPYIHYAAPYYDHERFQKEKNKLGKMLLVFFSHSGTGQTVEFDVDYLISKIEEVRSLFDNVVISLFWSDITPILVKKLTGMGYKIFSSGHRYDYYFLSRQKTIINLADMTMSNSVGTHIGYCTYLGKPHWIIRQHITKKSLNSIGTANIAISERLSKDSANTEELETFYKAFSEYHSELTSEQKAIASKFFGFNHIKSVEEMKTILI